MSRLIDEEKVIKIINERIRILKMQKGQAEKECRGGFDLRIAEAMLIKECIEALLTAYDVDKVVAELEGKIKDAEKIMVTPPQDKLDEIANDIVENFIGAWKSAIKVVRKGGAE